MDGAHHASAPPTSSLFALRDAAPGEFVWNACHRPMHEHTEPLILKQLMSDAEIETLLLAPGPAYPPRQHWMMRGTLIGQAAVHDVAEGHAHRKLFLHRGFHFQREHSQLHEKLFHAMTSQKDFPETGVATSELSIRCVEFHTYTAGGGLMSLGHRDRGSILTLSVLLSSPAACVGGEFITWTRDGTEKVQHGLQRGDGILFHSEKTHNVEMVTSGVRHSLVIELWKLPPGREAENSFDRKR